MAFLIFW